MKKIVKALLLKFGVIVMKRASRIYLPEDESYRIALEQCVNVAPVIIDGGAHTGGTVEAFSRLSSRARFHCFEPDATLASDLLLKFAGRDNVCVVEAALGAASGKATFNINASRPTNSLLPTADGLQTDLHGLCRTVEQVEVDVTSIDDYCRAQGIKQVDIIKLDLQGYDYTALKGAKSTLQSVRVVLVEVLFVALYQGCHLFPDILRLMMDEGFVLHTLCGIHYGEKDELLWADAVFVRRPSAALR